MQYKNSIITEIIRKVSRQTGIPQELIYACAFAQFEFLKLKIKEKVPNPIRFQYLGKFSLKSLLLLEKKRKQAEYARRHVNKNKEQT